MNAKRFLRNHFYANQTIDAEMEELNNLREKAIAIGSFDYTKDRVMSSPASDALYTSVVEKIAAREQVILNDIADQLKQKEAVRQVIDSVDQPELQAVLRYRYLSYMSFEDICKVMHRSRTSIYYLHKDALEFIKNIKV